MSTQKIGRNEPCLCGSGKKYKKCCAVQKPHQLPSGHDYIGHLFNGETKKFEISLFPGEESKISIVPDHIRSAGNPGKYTAKFLLSRPEHLPVPEGEIDLFDQAIGSSHLAITKPALSHPSVANAVAIRLEATADGFHTRFSGHPNPEGYLAKIESEPFEAQSFEDAHSRAYHLLAPILSRFSAELDIPVHVCQTLVIEQATAGRSARLLLLARESPLTFYANGKLGAEFSYYASLYREALNSNSSVYRFLCLFKVIEAIRARRQRIQAERLARGDSPLRLIERFPLDLTDLERWLAPIYRRQWQRRALEQILVSEVKGKKFNYVIDTHLVPLRNTIAHGILDSGELGMSIDDMLKLEKLNYVLPFTRVMVRRMLRNEFASEFLVGLPLTNDSSA